MKHFYRLILAFVLLITLTSSFALPPCQGSNTSKWNNCFGSWTWETGSKYTGDYQNGKRSGQGTYVWSNGDRYVGDFVDNGLNGQGTYTWPNGDIYVGDFKDNERTGQGTFTWPNGDKYAGGYIDGKRTGRGTFTWPNGDKYVGDFKDSKRTGQGTFTFADGNKYAGEYKDGIRSGQGVFIFASGKKYVGEFANGDFNGRGIMYDPAGKISESGIWNNDNLVISQYIDPNSFTLAKGNSSPSATDAQRRENERKAAQLQKDREIFEEEKRQAALERQRMESQKSKSLSPCQGADVSQWNNCYGSWTDSDGNQYVGEWKNGNFNGQGTYIWTEGAKHVGEYREGFRNGQGTTIYSNGDKYVGEWKDDKRNGLGTYFSLADNLWKGDKYVGEFKDGLFSGQGTYSFTSGNKYVGEWKMDKYNGRGILYLANGSISQSGIWNDGTLVTSQYVDPNSFTRIAKGNSAPSAAEAQRLENERKAAQLDEDRKRMEEEKRQVALERQRIESQKTQTQIAPDNRRRLALVIGNDSYRSMPVLNNAVNDSKSMSDALKQANFDVLYYKNLNKRGMEEALYNFAQKLGKDDVGMFYFAGHGVQANSKNFLIPVEENVKKSSDVQFEGIDVNRVMAYLQDSKNSLNIVVLDACRSSLPERGGMSRGLTVTEAPQGSIVAYATSPGKAASDGDGGNSPFTKNLIRVMQRKGVKIEDVFKEVRVAVSRETNGEQVPQEVSQLVGDFYFRP